MSNTGRLAACDGSNLTHTPALQQASQQERGMAGAISRLAVPAARY